MESTWLPGGTNRSDALDSTPRSSSSARGTSITYGVRRWHRVLGMVGPRSMRRFQNGSEQSCDSASAVNITILNISEAA
jgi:hypothetical protein